MAQASSLTTGNHIAEKRNEESKKNLKQTIAEYLNDTDLSNLKHITATYTTIALIIISVVMLVLETNTDISRKYGDVLKFIDLCIMSIFAAEYLLRIWVASETPEGTPGWKGSWKYITSLYGFIDLIAILPFFIGLMVPGIHTGFFRVFRLLRILMLGRYFKSFQILRRAIFDKKWEIFVSLQVVAVITVILSVILYEVEHNAPQPNKFTDIPTTLGWSIAKFVHDAAGTADFSPQTSPGKFIATVIGLLGIAIFAIPAGLVASGFLHEMEEEKKKKELDKKRERLVRAFREVHNEHLDEDMPRKYITMVQAKSRLNLSEQDIIDVAKQHKGIRLRYKRVNKTDVYPSALLIENYSPDTPYGTCITGENHRLTIICPDSYDETSIGHFSLCLARCLKASYISNELFGSKDGVDPTVACSFSCNEKYGHKYDKSSTGMRSELKKFAGDIREHVADGAFAIIIRSSTKILKQDADPSRRSSPPPVFSFGVMGEGGLNNLIDNIHNLKIPVAGSSITHFATDNNEHNSKHLFSPFKAEAYSRYSNDLYRFIERETTANVLNIYVHPELLEWVELDEYYGAIKQLADYIKQVLMKEGHDMLVYYPKDFHRGNGYATGSSPVNGTHASGTQGESS